jgi:hypothetical protein
MLMKLLGGGLIESVGGLVKTIFGDRAARDQQAADDQAAMRQQFAAEFQGPERRGPWNSLVDGLNRLPRPLMTFGMIGLFVWCVVDPVAFSASVQALGLVPEPMWIIMGTIVVFWFGGKTLEGIKAPTVKPAAVKAVLEGMRETRALALPPPMPNDEFRAEMTAPKPMSNAAILEWNRRRQEGWTP